jgi:type IV pilus assembly protein PilO
MAIQTGLEGKPWNVGLLWGGLAAGVVVGALWWFAISPVQDQIASEQTKLQDLQAQIQKGRTAQRNLPGLREEVHNLELELDKLLRILPARRNTPDLIRRLRLLVEQGDFNLKSFDPQLPIDRDFYQEWPIRISLDGSYHNLALFFDRISRFSRIINVENLEMRARSGEHSLSATFTAKTFIYKEPPAEEAVPGETP